MARPGNKTHGGGGGPMIGSKYGPQKITRLLNLDYESRILRLGRITASQLHTDIGASSGRLNIRTIMLRLRRMVDDGIINGEKVGREWTFWVEGGRHELKE